MNPIMLKIWIDREISKINFAYDFGTMSPAVALAKIELLEFMLVELDLDQYTQKDYKIEIDF